MMYLTPAEVATQLRVDVSTVQRWIRNGQLGALRVGRQYRIPQNELDSFVAERSMPAPQQTNSALAYG